MSRPGRLELAEYEMQKACKQNRKIPHPFVQFRQRRQALLHSIYQWVYARARLVGRTAEGQTGRQAETGSPKRSFRTTNDLHTRRQKKKKKQKTRRRGMLFTSPPSPLTPNFREFGISPRHKVLQRSQQKVCAAATVRRRVERSTSEFPIGPRVKNFYNSASSQEDQLGCVRDAYCTLEKSRYISSGGYKKKVLCSIH